MVLCGHTGVVIGAAYSPDGQRIATGELEGTVAVWDASRRTALLSLTGFSGAGSVAFASDGRQFIRGRERRSA